MTAIGLEEGKTFRPSLLIEAVKSLNRLMGADVFTSKDYESEKPVAYPGMVDITIRLKPKAP